MAKPSLEKLRQEKSWIDPLNRSVTFQKKTSLPTLDTGSYGFILPASQIRTVGSETVQAVHAMMRDLKTYRG